MTRARIVFWKQHLPLVVLCVIGFVAGCLVILALQDRALNKLIYNINLEHSYTNITSWKLGNKSVIKIPAHIQILGQALPRLKTVITDIFSYWPNKSRHFCNNTIIAFDKEFAFFNGVVIDKRFCKCQVNGSETIQTVLNQPEEIEYYKYERGCFQLPCSDVLSYRFNNNGHLNLWFQSIETHPRQVGNVIHDNRFTIAVQRYEYANLYHTMTDWYNAFLVMKFFNQTSHSTNILLIDAHPIGALDPVWIKLFNSTTKLSSYPNRTYFSRLAWGIMGYNSLMTAYLTPTRPPLFDEFHNFFLSAYNIKTNRQLDCQRLSILFIWRHNYIAHPRNPTGLLSRKIRNEAELMKYIQERHPLYKVKGVQIDLFDMQQQLQYVADADILIGMHGAGLTHALFLPKRAALIELVPSYWSATAEHFLAVAAWRNIIYHKWANDNLHLESNDQSTTIPPAVVNTFIRKATKQLCPKEIVKKDDVKNDFVITSTSPDIEIRNVRPLATTIKYDSKQHLTPPGVVQH